MKNKLSEKITNLLNRNYVLYVVSVVCALCIWFFLAAENKLGRSRVIYDVPITINLSDAAVEEGVRVFEQSVSVASVSISGNQLITDRVTANELSIVGNLSPMTSKLTGKTMQKENVNLSVNKQGSAFLDYNVDNLSPSTIMVIYDRYKEKTFTIENNIKYEVEEDMYIQTPYFSHTQVVVSGPESSVNKISKVSVDWVIDTSLKESTQFTSSLTMYDEFGNSLNKDELYLQTDLETVDVQIQVYNKQTVNLEVTKLNTPTVFGENRIQIDPKTIDIAGDLDLISQYSTIKLTTPIDFNNLNLEFNSYEMEIPLPAQVQNINKIESATVTVDLSGYEQIPVNVTTFEDFVNVPANKEVTMVSKFIEAQIMCLSTQKSMINANNVYALIDMAGYTSQNGDVQVPVQIIVSGVDTAWVYGTYTATVNVHDKVKPASIDISSSQTSSK